LVRPLVERLHMTIWDFLVYAFWFYIWFSCIFIFITVIIDVFRDHSLNGWAKALWLIFLLVLPFLGAIIYLIARGRSMSERKLAEVQAAQAAQNSYIQSVAGTTSATDEIVKAKALLDSGAISDEEFTKLKAAALA
jgi:hypothetical protein